MRRKLHQEIGNIFIEASKGKLKPLAAYDFAGHIVVTTQMVGWYGKTVYCRYFNGDREEIGPALSAVVFPESTVYCCRQDDVAYMSVTVDEFETSNGTLWLIDRKNNTPKYGLSLCLAPLYGNESKWLLLAELFEHYKIQGVQYFYVYVKDVDEYSHQLLDDYVKTNEAELVPLSMEGESVDESIKRQHVGVNDCLHRSRRHSRYAILVDLDERLQPTGGYTLENFVRRKMSEMPSLAMIRFTSRWVLREHELPQSYEGEKTLKNFLPMLVSRNTSAIPPRRVIQKCVINPKRVLIQSIHQSLAYYPTFHGYDVPFEDGHIRHYRYLNGGNWSKSWLDRLSYYGAFESTEYPRQYISLLYSRIKKRLDYVYRNQPVPNSAETRDETSKRELKN
ncbi:hypothetical protein Q1695_007767 [Nippostrongylus brasiliensis]|nr:hypothetical protein Q1695_007767 [Nippostrongylus brasiliensis]